MSIRMASDEVTDGIAAIEMHRQGTEKESGLAAACSEALRKLQALLDQEKQALQLHGPDTVYAINVEAVTNEINRVQSMVGGRGQGQGQGQGPGVPQRNARPRGQKPPRPDKPHNAPRNRGRRAIGRSGSRGGRGGAGGSGGAGPGPGVR